jgi:hypothetical protein
MAGATSGGGVLAVALNFFRKSQQTKGTENETGRKTNRSGVGS